MRMKLLTLLSFLLFSQVVSAETKSLRWKIKNASWNDAFEKSYSDFIRTLGKARKKGACRTTDECLRSPVANPKYSSMNPSGLSNVFTDCADLPYILRAYFAWMNDLPFSYPTDLAEAEKLSRKLKDIRYSKYGNIILSKHHIGNGENINRVLQNLSDTISTASFRTNAGTNDSGDLFRDTYPVEIDRRAIAPGTIVYDPNGHVAVVYEVTNSGQIFLIDAHPDNSLTTIIYGEKFARSGIRVGGGFSNFRPFSYSRGDVDPKSNSELSGFSLIQYSKGPFIFKGKEMSFYEYVRAKMADGDIIYDPINEFTNFMDELCQDIKYREEAVDIAIKANIDNVTHPRLLPDNIYGADGEWEAYATPGRDARFKASVRETKNYLNKVIKGFENKSIQVIYQGLDLAGDLRELYWSKSRACKITPVSNTTMNLDQVLLNLFKLSFDPYHCVELRWGITGANTCEMSANKKKWYLAEQGLRNRVDRDYSVKTSYDVDDLPKAPVSQVEQPDLSFDKILQIERAN